jgi:hypothetical protein
VAGQTRHVYTDNSSLHLKWQIRRWIWDRIPDHRVLDLYCGSQGRMWECIWRDAEEYLGVDKFRPHNHAITLRMSAERASQQMDLSKYTIFDVDCYDSPWMVARRICKRFPAGRFGLALTAGDSRSMRTGSSNEVSRRTLGISGFSDLRLLYRYRELVVSLMVRSLGEIAGMRLVAGVRAEVSKQNAVTYLGLVCEKSKPR